MPGFQDVWSLLKTAGAAWVDDKASRLGAALAYYAAFSLAPLLIISIAIAGLVFGKDATRNEVLAHVSALVGKEGAAAIQTMIASASNPRSGIVAGIVGAIMLVVGAAGLFGQLQDALDTVWGVEPRSGLGILGFLRERFLSLTMVMGTTFLLLVSLVISTALSALGGFFGHYLAGLVGQIANVVVSFAFITLLFAMVYRYLPDAIIAWKDVWLGSLVTSLLFTLGKQLIGMYLGYTATSSAYGAAGSFAVLLIWLYYSSQIFLFGAELTKTYAMRYGSRIRPAPNAQFAHNSNAAQKIHESNSTNAPREEAATR
jgi:membrane protein